MEDRLYIVIWQDSRKIWHAEAQGVFAERRMAENLIECKKSVGETYKFAIVEGPIVSPEAMAKVEARLGKF